MRRGARRAARSWTRQRVAQRERERGRDGRSQVCARWRGTRWCAGSSAGEVYAGAQGAARWLEGYTGEVHTTAQGAAR